MDYLSAKKLRKNYEGQIVPPMGCRAFLSPWKDENGEYKLYGRLNMGVCTVNLVDVGLTANKDMDKFWKILDNILELCYEAQTIRFNRCCELTSDSSPVHFQYGAICRLPKHASIKPILVGGRSTITLGYAGLYECVLAMLGISHTTYNGKKFGLEIMRFMNKKVKEWKERDGLGWALYGTPMYMGLQVVTFVE